MKITLLAKFFQIHLVELVRYKKLKLTVPLIWYFNKVRLCELFQTSFSNHQRHRKETCVECVEANYEPLFEQHFMTLKNLFQILTIIFELFLYKYLLLKSYLAGAWFITPFGPFLLGHWSYNYWLYSNYIPFLELSFFRSS